MRERLNEAIELAQAGRREDARALLLQMLDEAPRLEAGWLWLASVASSQAERIDALKHVLAINPQNEQAKSALGTLGVAVDEPPSVRPQPSPSSPPEAPATGNLTAVQVGALAIFLTIAAVALFFLGGEAIAILNPTQTPTPTATATATVTSSPTITPSPTITNTPGPSSTPFQQPTLAPTWTPPPTLTPQPTRTLAPTITPFPTRTVPPSATPLPPTATFTAEPSATPVPPEPTATPTAAQRGWLVPSGSS